jgi:HK97 family phage portal protein
MVKNSRPDLVWDKSVGQFGGWVPKPQSEPQPQQQMATEPADEKALAAMQWGRTSSWYSMLLGSTTFDYRASAGDGKSNAAVMSCVRWAQRTLPEAPLQIMERNSQGELKPKPDHALQRLFETPNPFYSGLHLLGAAFADLMLSGNAYLIKVRSRDGRVVQLWWAPASLMEPAWPDNDPSIYISHYNYTVEGDVIPLDPSDVVHFRDYQTDPSNVRKGISPLASLYREIASDNEAANWTGSLLRNGAIPGVVISPQGETGASESDLEDVKLKFMQRFGGDQRGAPLVMKGATDVKVLSFNPSEMNLRDLRIVPEERITAVLGIPAIVVGLGAGLQRSTFANYAEAREAAYESFIIPMQRLIMAQLQAQLVPDFGDPLRLRVQFDLSEVRVLQQDENALHERTRADLLAGLVTLNQALEMIGEDPLSGAEGDVRFVPGTVTVTPLDRLIPPEPQEQPALPTDGTEPTPLPTPDQQRAMAAAGARNGDAKVTTVLQAPHEGIGLPLGLSDDDLARLSAVTEDDLSAVERFWRKAVDGTGLEDLLDAAPSEGND